MNSVLISEYFSVRRSRGRTHTHTGTRSRQTVWEHHILPHIQQGHGRSRSYCARKQGRGGGRGQRMG